MAKTRNNKPIIALDYSEEPKKFESRHVYPTIKKVTETEIIIELHGAEEAIQRVVSAHDEERKEKYNDLSPLERLIKAGPYSAKYNEETKDWDIEPLKQKK